MTGPDAVRSKVSDPGPVRRGLVWSLFAVTALLLLGLDDLPLWTMIVVSSALVLALVPGLRPSASPSPDRRDLVAVAVLYIAVVAAFRLAFSVFTTERVLGLFLSFAFGLLLGVVGPVVYQVWMRRGELSQLGIGLHRLAATAGLGVVLAAIQFSMTLWGRTLPEPVDWVPLLVMSLAVGLFEAVFFRGFVQGRLEASFGAGPAVAGASFLYALYHVGYGMGLEEMWFLFGLGVVYAIAYRLTTNILVLWPLLTPVGSFYNNLESGDISLPWESILGFADVALVMVVVVWLAHRHVRRRDATVGGRAGSDRAGALV